MTEAKRAGRICVWPTSTVAAEADTAESKHDGRLVVWPTVAQADANMTLEDGGAAPTPVAVADFANAVYSAGASSYAVTAFLAADAESGSTFNAADIVAGQGLRGGPVGSSTPTVTGALLDAMLGDTGCTFVVAFAPGAPFAVNFDAFDSPDWNFDVSIGLSIETGIYRCSFQSDGLSNPDDGPATAEGKAAFLFTQARLATSVNGGEVFDHMPPDEPEWALLTKLYFGTFQASYIRSIKVYAPQDDATLQVLSG